MAAAADAFGQAAIAKGSGRFLVESPGDREVSWTEFIEMRNRLASALWKRGIVEGDTIICYGNNGLEWVLARATATVMSCYFVPMNWHLAAPEVAYICDNCDGVAMLVDAAFLPTLSKGRQGSPELFKKLRHYLVWGSDGRVNDFGESLEAALASADSAFPQVERVIQRSMLYTGGTSGKPKAVINRGPQQVKPGTQPSAEAIEEAKKAQAQQQLAMGPEGLNLIVPNLMHLVPAPLYHAAPHGFLCVALGAAMPMVVMQKFNAASFLELTEKYKATNCIMPPILVKRICDLPEAKIQQHDISSLSSVISVGAACPMPVKEAAVRVGLPLHEFYGSSELGMNTVLQTKDMLRKPGSCGRILPGCNLKIFNEDGKECSRGQQGILYVQTQLEYYNAAQKSKDAQLNLDPSWCTVGDIAYVDEEDFVYICDRKIDMIISGGANIYPAEVEDCLFRHPAVADCAVFGTPDPEYGENVHAAILLKDGQRALSAELQEFARKYIAGFKVPKAVTFHEDFPRTPSGKILKRELRQLLESRSEAPRDVGGLSKL